MNKKGYSSGNFVITCIIIFFCAFLFFPLLNFFIYSIINFTSTDNSNSNSCYTSTADGFTIEKYNVNLGVSKDNKVYVTERIDVNWNEANHHGIYKNIPLWLKYTSKDGKTVKRKSNISNLKSLYDPYSTKYFNDKAIIYIGNADSYVPLGDKTYYLNYMYDMGEDPFKNHDEFIFHVYGDYWGTEIKNASINVKMPKSIEGYKINFFLDKYRKNNINKYMDYVVDGDHLSAKFNSEKYYNDSHKKYCNKKENLTDSGVCNEKGFKCSFIPLSSSLTVDIELPEGYFEGGSNNYGWGSLILSIIIIILTCITIYKWIRYGKDFKKTVETVEFYPPNDLDPAEIGYLNGNLSDKKLTFSLIIQLASKGYIKIDEIKDEDSNKDDIQITNLLVKPEKICSFEEFLPKRLITVHKVKDIGNDLTTLEEQIMKKTFKDYTNVVVEEDIDKFLSVKDSLVNKKYIKISKDNITSIESKMDTYKKEYNKLLKKYDEENDSYQKKMKGIKPLSNLEKIVFDMLFEEENVVLLGKHKTFYKAFEEVDKYLTDNFYNIIYDVKAYKAFVSTFVRGIFIAIFSFLSYFIIEDMPPSFAILYLISFICLLINIYFTLIMQRKTKYGEEMKARVNGFKHFLETAEKDRLEALVNECPQYFYNILPYTYVLGISKKWVDKFENITMINYDMGNFDYSNLSSFDSFSYSFGSSCGGCSSFGGGGCSSCGGGCSSCGGGGSW